VAGQRVGDQFPLRVLDRERQFKEGIDLCGIDREQGQAGAQFLGRAGSRISQRAAQQPVGPAAVRRELLDESGDFGRLGEQQPVAEDLRPDKLVTLPRAKTDERQADRQQQSTNNVRPAGGAHHGPLRGRPVGRAGQGADPEPLPPRREIAPFGASPPEIGLSARSSSARPRRVSCCRRTSHRRTEGTRKS